MPQNTWPSGSENGRGPNEGSLWSVDFIETMNRMSLFPGHMMSSPLESFFSPAAQARLTEHLGHTGSVSGNANTNRLSRLAPTAPGHHVLTSLRPVVLRHYTNDSADYRCKILPQLQNNKEGEIMGLSCVALEDTTLPGTAGDHLLDARAQELIRQGLGSNSISLEHARDGKMLEVERIIAQMEIVIKDRLENRMTGTSTEAFENFDDGKWTVSVDHAVEPLMTRGQPYWVKPMDGRSTANLKGRPQRMIVFGDGGEKTSIILTSTDFSRIPDSMTGGGVHEVVQGAYLHKTGESRSEIRFFPLAYQDMDTPRRLFEEKTSNAGTLDVGPENEEIRERLIDGTHTSNELNESIKKQEDLVPDTSGLADLVPMALTALRPDGSQRHQATADTVGRYVPWVHDDDSRAAANFLMSIRRSTSGSSD